MVVHVTSILHFSFSAVGCHVVWFVYKKLAKAFHSLFSLAIPLN
jgi:hypothetical protein